MLGEPEVEAPPQDRHVERRHVEAPVRRCPSLPGPAGPSLPHSAPFVFLPQFEKGGRSRAGLWPTGAAQGPAPAPSAPPAAHALGPGRSGPTSMLAGIGTHIAGAGFADSFYKRLDSRKRTTAHAPAAVAPPGYGVRACGEVVCVGEGRGGGGPRTGPVGHAAHSPARSTGPPSRVGCKGRRCQAHVSRPRIAAAQGPPLSGRRGWEDWRRCIGVWARTCGVA